MSDASPTPGVDWPTLAVKLKAPKADVADWRPGRLASHIYFFREELLSVQQAAYTS
jgi:hypothetical protein